MFQRQPRRTFTPEQKVSFIQEIESASSIKDGCEKTGIHSTQYRKWKKQYSLGIKSSLRNHKPRIDPEYKRLLEENRILKHALLNLSVQITDLKKTVSY